MVHHSGYQFTTKDQDNDRQGETNCAQEHFGAWWYMNCHRANLNGLYLGGETDQYATGITWITWRGQYYSLIKTEMKLRPTEECN